MKSGILANPTTACALERCVLARKLFLAAARLSVHLQFAKLRRLHRPVQFISPLGVSLRRRLRCRLAGSLNTPKRRVAMTDLVPLFAFIPHDSFASSGPIRLRSY
jgi:hypothetical protein